MSTSTEHLHIDPTEKRWMIASVGLLLIFFAAVTVAGFMLGIQVPTRERRVDPNTVAEQPPWSEPGVREIVPGEEYEVYVLAHRFSFTPNEIEVPAGAKVTFYVTSTDVQHGFKLQDTNVNFMALPGQVSKLSTTFEKPGVYPYICTEYCGLGHAVMAGAVTVTEAP